MRNRDIVLTDTNLKQVIYMFNCVDCTVVVKGKINQITLGTIYCVFPIRSFLHSVVDNCRKVALVVDTIVSSVDVVNCANVQVQITDKAPTISIDKTDNDQIFLSKTALGVEILTSKTTGVNVMTPGKTEADDMVSPDSLVIEEHD